MIASTPPAFESKLNVFTAFEVDGITYFPGYCPCEETPLLIPAQSVIYKVQATTLLSNPAES
jgi:hypothetical protein